MIGIPKTHNRKSKVKFYSWLGEDDDLKEAILHIANVLSQIYINREIYFKYPSELAVIADRIAKNIIKNDLEPEQIGKAMAEAEARLEKNLIRSHFSDGRSKDKDVHY